MLLWESLPKTCPVSGNAWRWTVHSISRTSEERRCPGLNWVLKLHELETRRPSTGLGLRSRNCDLARVNASLASKFRNTGRSRRVACYGSARYQHVYTSETEVCTIRPQQGHSRYLRNFCTGLRQDILLLLSSLDSRSKVRLGRITTIFKLRLWWLWMWEVRSFGLWRRVSQKERRTDLILPSAFTGFFLDLVFSQEMEAICSSETSGYLWIISLHYHNHDLFPINSFP